MRPVDLCNSHFKDEHPSLGVVPGGDPSGERSSSRLRALASAGFVYSAEPHLGVFDRDERRESQPLTSPSSSAPPEGSPLGSRPTTKTAATQSPVKDSGISRPETPAIGKETSSAPLLISCGIPRTIQRSMPFRSRWAEALRFLGPATPLSRNRGSCPNRTPLTDFCFQTPSAGTTTNNCSPRETALSRFPLAHQDRSPVSCGRRGTRVTPG